MYSFQDDFLNHEGDQFSPEQIAMLSDEVFMTMQAFSLDDMTLDAMKVYLSYHAGGGNLPKYAAGVAITAIAREQRDRLTRGN